MTESRRRSAARLSCFAVVRSESALMPSVIAAVENGTLWSSSHRSAAKRVPCCGSTRLFRIVNAAFAPEKLGYRIPFATTSTLVRLRHIDGEIRTQYY